MSLSLFKEVFNEKTCKCIQKYTGGGSRFVIIQLCVLFSVIYVFGFIGCKQDIKPQDGSHPQEITIIVNGDENVIVSASDTFKTKKGSAWSAIKTEAEKKVSYKPQFKHSTWKLKDKNGEDLKAGYLFEKDSIVFAVSKPDNTNPPAPSEEITITVKGDENVSVSVPSSFKIAKNSNWTAVKKEAEKKVSYKHGFQADTWKHTDSSGNVIKDDEVFSKDSVVFAVSKVSSGPSAFKWRFASAGDGTTYAIRSDGSLWACGWNEEGQLGVPSAGQKASAFTRVGTDTDWKFVTGGKAYAFLIKENGSLWALGDNQKAVQGVGNGKKNKTPAQIGADTDWIYVTASRFWGYNGFAIKEDGSLWGWGDNEYKQLTASNTGKVIIKPVQIGTEKDWSKVSVGENHVLALKKDGSLWVWGNNLQKALGLGSGGAGICKVPTRIGNGNTWTDIRAVSGRSYALKQDGSLWACGHNPDNIIGFNQTGSDYKEYVDEFTKITALQGQIADITGDEVTMIAAIGSGSVIEKVYAWGLNADGAFGDGKGVKLNTSEPIPSSTVPVEAILPENIKFTCITSGQAYTILISEDGKMYGWGRNTGGQLGDKTDIDKLPTSFYKKFIEIECPQN